MKKLKSTLFQLVIALFVASSLSSCGYNSMVNKEEAVTSQWAQVENVYQRRADLIPNLVKTVEGAANFEKSTLTDVIEARASATQTKIDPSNLTPENIARFEQSQNNLSGALSRLLVTVEAYPNLKANQNFLELSSQLEGTENRIAVERNKFNTVVQDYNSYIRRFPNNLFAGLFGFEKKGYFQSAPGSDKAPKVDFDFGDKEKK
ncbi:MAG: LemA family protein [Bacteroidia bacterium]